MRKGDLTRGRCGKDANAEGRKLGPCREGGVSTSSTDKKKKRIEEGRGETIPKRSSLADRNQRKGPF